MKKAVWIPLVCIGGIIATYFTVVAAFAGIIVADSMNTRKNHPSKQPGTTWATEDGKVEFCVMDEDGFATVQTPEGPVEIVITMWTVTTEITMYYEDEYLNNSASEGVVLDTVACGWSGVIDNHIFVIEITSADKYFEAGEKLVFYKVEE